MQSDILQTEEIQPLLSSWGLSDEDLQYQVEIAKKTEPDKSLTTSEASKVAAIITARNILSGLGINKYENSNYQFQKQGDIIIITAKDDRGEIVRQQDGQVTGQLSNQDVVYFSQLNRAVQPETLFKS